MAPSGTLLALAAAVSTANAAFQGFNYGATFTNGALKVQSDFEAEFKTAAGLEGTDGTFNSARLYTMVVSSSILTTRRMRRLPSHGTHLHAKQQGNTPNDPISAIPAAISTKTSLLLGLWTSAGGEAFNNEIEALQKTIDQYCGKLDGLVAGISVGSEDLYRNSPTGIVNNENPGANPDVLVDYIGRVRETIKGSCLSDVPIGHVDTWTAFANSSNNAVIEALDWLGMDAYAYFEDTMPNGIENGASLFKAALDKTKAAAGGREIWITETGWPVSGKDFGDAVASKENARKFWKDVGCPMFGSTNVWWYTLQDSAPDTPSPSFGVIGGELTTKPLYDLSCDGSSNSDTNTSKPSTKPSAKPSTKPTEPESTAESTAEPESTAESTAESEPTTESSAESSEAGSSQSEAPASSPTLPTTPIVYPIPTHELPSTHEPVPIPTVSHGNSSVIITRPTPTVSLPTTSGGAGSPSETTQGEQVDDSTGTDESGSAPTDPAAAGSQLNSFRAAAVAVVLAAALL